MRQIVIEATEERTGPLAKRLAASQTRGILRIGGYMAPPAPNANVTFGDMSWIFDGPQVFKKRCRA